MRCANTVVLKEHFWKIFQMMPLTKSVNTKICITCVCARTAHIATVPHNTLAMRKCFVRATQATKLTNAQSHLRPCSVWMRNSKSYFSIYFTWKWMWIWEEIHASCSMWFLCFMWRAYHGASEAYTHFLSAARIYYSLLPKRQHTDNVRWKPISFAFFLACTLTQLAHTMHVGNAILEMNMNGKKIEFNANMNGVSSLTFFVIVTRFSIIFGASMWDALRGFYGAASCDFCILLSSARRHFFSEAERSDSWVLRNWFKLSEWEAMSSCSFWNQLGI